MIGNSFPFKDTGYSLLESGEIDKATCDLNVSGYRVVSPAGDDLGLFLSVNKAERFIEAYIEAHKPDGKCKERQS